jgi:hypothetical protein
MMTVCPSLGLLQGEGEIQPFLEPKKDAESAPQKAIVIPALLEEDHPATLLGELLGEGASRGTTADDGDIGLQLRPTGHGDRLLPSQPAAGGRIPRRLPCRQLAPAAS